MTSEISYFRLSANEMSHNQGKVQPKKCTLRAKTVAHLTRTELWNRSAWYSLLMF